jgi:hypothetical protein
MVCLAAAAPGWAQTHSLAEAPVAGKYFRIQLDMTLAGDIKFEQGGKKVSLKQTARASHFYLERVLDVGPTGLPAKTARLYQTARAKVTVANQPRELTLRAERCLMVAQRHKDQGLSYCPAGPLTAEERELTEHFDSLAVTGLLPGKAVAVGATWKVANAAVQALCNFEGLTSQDLVCKLERVQDGVAHVSVAGKAAGIDTGALVKLDIHATYQFNLKGKRLVSLEWHQKDERDQGPASPAATADVTTRLTRTPIEPAKELSDVALVSVPDGYEPPVGMTQITYTDPKKRFDLLYPREWRVVGRTDDHFIMRLMDRGDFIAQATVTPWTGDLPGKHMTPETFQEAMAETAGWEADQVLQAGEVNAEEGRWVYRISALGKLDGLKVMQNFYLVAGPKGDQVVLVFTMTPAQAQKIGTRDLSLVGSLDFPAAAKDADKKKSR